MQGIKATRYARSVDLSDYLAGPYEPNKEADRVDAVEQERAPQSSHQQPHGSFVQLPGENVILRESTISYINYINMLSL